MLIPVKELRDYKKPECFLIRSFRSVSKQNWDGAFATLSMELEVTQLSKLKYTTWAKQNLTCVWPTKRICLNVIWISRFHMTKRHFCGNIVLKTASARGNFNRRFLKVLNLLKCVKRKGTNHIKLHFNKKAMTEVYFCYIKHEKQVHIAQNNIWMDPFSFAIPDKKSVWLFFNDFISKKYSVFMYYLDQNLKSYISVREIRGYPISYFPVWEKM